MSDMLYHSAIALPVADGGKHKYLILHILIGFDIPWS